MIGFTLNERQLCAFKYSGFWRCSLDIGGSVTAAEGFSRFVNSYAVAVASGGTCDQNKPILYTKVGVYSDWIVSKLEK